VKNEDLNTCLTGMKPLSLPGSEEKPAESEEKRNRDKRFPGILEEGLVYSCAGPRIDPDKA